MKRKSVVILLLTITAISTGCANTASTPSYNNDIINTESTEIEMSGEDMVTEAETEAYSEDDEWTKVELINARISEVTDSEEYNSASIEEREKMVLPVLADLEDRGYIKNLYYDKDSKTFTFQYYNDVLGGVMIKDWDPMMN